MPSPCPRCGKPVYLVDELRCLEKVWHKDCFRCLTCNRLLTILTYSGFDKQPYCEQHLPEAKHTSVADSFATRHAKEAARLQSLLEYRKEYEATKGDKISVADDVLTRRLLANARNVGPAQRCWNRERKRAMDDDPDQVTAEDDVMAPAPEECIVLGPIDEHQDQSRPLTHSEATPSCSADPAELSPHDELPGNSITLMDTIIEQQLNNTHIDALSCIVEQDDCRRCQGPLNPRTRIDYKNKAWHRKCFQCQLCGSPVCFALQMEQQVVPVCINRNKGIAHSESRKTPEELAEEEEIATEVARALAWPRTKRVAVTTEAPALVAYDDAAATTVTDDDAAAAVADDADAAAVDAIADDVAASSVSVVDVGDAATATHSGDLALLAEPTPEVVRRRQPDVAQLAARASADERGAGDGASKRPSSGVASRFRAIRRAINVAYSAAAQKLRQALQSKRAKKKAKQAGKSKAPKAASTSFASSAPSSSMSSSSDSSSAAALESAQLEANEHRETAPPAAGSERGAALVQVPIDDELEFDIVLVPGASDHMTRTLPFTRLHVSLPRTSTPTELSPRTAARILELYIPVCFHQIGETPEKWQACVDTGVSSPEPPQAQAHSTPAKPLTGSCWGRFAPAAAPAEFAAALSVPKASAFPSGDEALLELQAVQSAATRGSKNTREKRERNKARRALFFPPTGIGEGVQSTRREHEAHDAAPNLAASAGVRAAQECCSTSRDEEGSAAEQQKANVRDSAASHGNSSDGGNLQVAVIQSPIIELYGSCIKELAARGLALPTIPERSDNSISTSDAPSPELVPALPSLVITENSVAGRYPRYQRGDLLINVKPVTTGGFVVGTIARTGDRGFVRVEHVRDPQRQPLP